ncbi:MAG: hypothetical protein US42_C0023G0006 [Candidatus Magasanikbacteria bacterium GW2011_GWC2_37_14]|uniref:Uncharacterized protein n=1 Tax=Candidatus Magasanikbacteria bacterium GW2011_GWC2_37_14 TaxID=1619046 RepID=A0A0G0G6R2_9BACT|nr:MAG: hypothetical protein US42_C0023G0006 [Candidatus Magasanikbacteria bacterium GW2011_GWC2_37_14]
MEQSQYGTCRFQEIVLNPFIRDPDVWYEFCRRFMCLFDKRERLQGEQVPGATRAAIEQLRIRRPKLYSMAQAANAGYYNVED